MSNRSLMRYRKPKGLFGRIQQLILQPILFFQTLPEAGESRSWLWAALLTLLLLGYAVVRNDTLLAENSGIENDVQTQLVLALSAAGAIVLGWIVQMLFLALVTMLQGQKPIWSLNLRIVIWASIPLLLMAIVQIAYMMIGGRLLDMASLADDALSSATPDNVFILLTHFFRQLTIFNLWRMVLFYLGATHSLNGSKWLAALLTVLSFISLFLIPTVWQIFLG